MPLTPGVPAHLVSDWSADEQYLLYSQVDAEGGRDLWYLNRTTGEAGYESSPFLRTPFNEEAAKFSPDGRFVVYVSDESRRYEVFIRSFPRGDYKWQVSIGGGSQPRWSKDGREIFFVHGDTLMVVPVSTAPNFQLGPPAELFRSTGFRSSRTYAPQYDVSASGDRFVTIEAAGEVAAPVIRVIQNWYSEFQDRHR
ncbi:MAG: hypothetical protein GY953_44105 [bacterium]|nr:hypothetical protein [bacterium]